MSENIPLRVCYFGTYRSEYSRNQVMIEGLRRFGVEVIECQEQLWRGVEDRVQATSGGWLKPAFWGRILRAYARLLKRYRSLPVYDILVVGYPGQFDVFLARLLSRLRRKPLAWDVFMSIYLIALERGLDRHSRLTVSLIRKVEQMALRLPDLLIQDTAEYVDWLHATHGISPGRFGLVPTGADDRTFRPALQVEPPGDTFRVVYYGTFIPNHSVETIVEAARLLADQPGIHFELIGQGPDREKCQEMAKGYHLENVTFVDWLDKEALVERAARADICLGAFGVTPQSLMTVQNKIFEGLAMGRAMITGDGPAVRAAFRHGEHLYLCERKNPAALADAIKALQNDPELRNRLGQNGYCLFTEKYNLAGIGRQYASHLSKLAKK